MRVAHFMGLAGLAGLAAVYLGSEDAPEQEPADEPLTHTSAPTPPPPPACEYGTPISGQLYPNGSEIEFRSGPGSEFDHIVNSRATQALGRTKHRTLWPTMVLNGLCETDQWVQGKIIEADGESADWEKGWVQKVHVTGTMSDEQKRGLLWDIAGEADFTKAEKALLRQGALKVLAAESNCREVITGYRSGSREGAYYVTCNARNGGAPFNVWFTPDEVDAGAALGVPAAFPEEASRDACKAAIEEHVVHPSTLEVHGLLGYATEVHNNGNRTVVQEFTASNGFGVDLRYTATCLVLPTGSLEFHAAESR